MSTRVRITNSNIAGLGASYQYYIELYVTKTEYTLANDVISYNLPVPPGDYLSGGVPVPSSKYHFDMKQWTEQYQVNAKIEKDSNKDSSWNTSALTTAMRVYDRLNGIAKTGGVVQMEFYDGYDTRTVTGMITDIGYTEEPQGDEDGGGGPPNLLVQFTFVVGLNSV
jgi:hypothetical protein